MFKEGVSLVYYKRIFTSLCRVSIVDFGQVNVCWVDIPVYSSKTRKYQINEISFFGILQ